MSPAQILYLNMITNSPIELTLDIEYAIKDVMHHRPRSLSYSLFSFGLILDTLVYGVPMGVLSLLSNIITILCDTSTKLLKEKVKWNKNEGIQEENCKIGFFARSVDFILFL